MILSKKDNRKDEDFYYVKVHKDKLSAFVGIVSFCIFFMLYFGLLDLFNAGVFVFLFIFVFAAAPITALFHKIIMSFLQK